MSDLAIAASDFTDQILEILRKHFGEDADLVFSSSPVLGYLNIKTKSANRGSKSRGSFANHYALYVLVEDYISKGYLDGRTAAPYSQYLGARFSDLMRRQRQLPFGGKLQNHALNSRLNEEFRKFYPTIGKVPIVRDLTRQRYWLQEDLLLVQIRDRNGIDQTHNIAAPIIEIIDKYVSQKREAFEEFLSTSQQLAELDIDNAAQARTFLLNQLQPNVDARVFEIVSYSVLKAHYGRKAVWLGWTRESISEQSLVLYKTGRTNANDGGIDFVMKPLGRFFQVTETNDAGKYFLDIDKVQRFPITFVVKSAAPIAQIMESLRAQAVTRYKVDAVVETYMNAIEEIVNTELLVQVLDVLVKEGRLREIMDEIVAQSRVEFNFNESDSDIVTSEDVPTSIDDGVSDLPATP